MRYYDEAITHLKQTNPHNIAVKWKVESLPWEFRSRYWKRKTPALGGRNALSGVKSPWLWGRW